MIGVIFALIIGILVGTLTGLFPGIHINLVSALLLSLIASGSFAGVEPMTLGVFVVAMAITHTMIDFIPSVFLGAPDDESYLSVLPGHELLKKGKGLDAVVATFMGCLAALPFALVFSIIFVLSLESVYEITRVGIPFILIFASAYMILREENYLRSLGIFLMAGVLGLLTLNLGVKEPLLPMLTGLFGVSSLVVSLKDKVEIPEQKVSRVRLRFKEFWRTWIVGGIVAPFFSFLPAIGGGQAAVIASEISGKGEKDGESFLFLVGMVNLSVMMLSFVTLYVIGKGRTGAAVAVGDILGEFGAKELAIILGVAVVSATGAFMIGLKITRVIAKNISKINYGKISVVVIGTLILMNLILTNWLGIVVLITSSALGIFCILTGARRISLMGCLLVPTIFYYLI